MARLRVLNRLRSPTSRRLLESMPPRLGLVRELGRHVRRITPEALQAVEATGVLGEDVEDEVAEIEKDPAPGRRPFHEQRFDPQLPRSLSCTLSAIAWACRSLLADARMK